MHEGQVQSPFSQPQGNRPPDRESSKNFLNLGSRSKSGTHNKKQSFRFSLRHLCRASSDGLQVYLDIVWTQGKRTNLQV